jgi:hypothetical protein
MAQGWTSNESIDLDNVSDEPPGPPDDGVYAATITRAEPEPTKKNDPGVGLDLRLDGDVYGNEGCLEGKSRNIRFQKITFSKEALFRLKNLCKSLGINPPANTGFEAIKDWCEELVGQRVFVRTKKRPRMNDKSKVDAAIDRYFTEQQAQEAASGVAADASGTDAAGEAEEPNQQRRRRAG